MDFAALKTVKAYAIDWHPTFGMAAGDYGGGRILLHPNPAEPARPVTEIDAVACDGRTDPLAFVHGVAWTGDGHLLACLSKCRRHAPKGQGSVLEIDPQTRKAKRLDDLFVDPSLETFPTFAVRLENGSTAIAYSGIGALAVVDAHSNVETLVADAASRVHFRAETCRTARLLDARLDDPHGLAESGGGLCVADTGNGAILRVAADGLCWLDADDAGRAVWSPQPPQRPLFEKPLSLTSRDGRLRIGLLGAAVAYLEAPDARGGMALVRRTLAGKRRRLFGLLPLPGAGEPPQVFDSHDMPGYTLFSDAKRGIFLLPQE